MVCSTLARRLVVALFLIATIWSGAAQAALSPEIQKGLDWLQAQVQADGSLAGEPGSIATPLQGRMEALATFKLLSSTPPSLVAAVAADTENNTEYKARQIISQSLAGLSAAMQLEDLVSGQNDDGGFGGAPGFASNSLDTAWAMLALNAANSSNSAAISAATGYLLASQDAIGGYSVMGNGSHPYITALAAIALQTGPNNPATANALNKVNSWLLSQQQADGGWGGVDETSEVYLALLGTTSDPDLRNRVTVLLASRQMSDGSWGGDPYVTALALRALIAQPRPVPTTGNIVVQVVDGASGQPIPGASAFIRELPEVTASSDSSGKIMLSAVLAGSYTLTIGSAGYASQSLGFSLQAGTTADLGVAKLVPAPTTGILQGVVKDGATGAALGGVTISVSGSANATGVSLADGSYRMTGLAPGAVVVGASKAGYVSSGGSGAIVAGSILLFSPALQPEGMPTGTMSSVIGQVVDAITQAPLSGVVVTVGTTGKTAISGMDGRFSVTELAPGTYPVSFMLTGYAAKNLSAVLVSAGGVTDIQVVNLSKAISSVAVTGKITSLNSGQPIAGATVTVLGSSLSVTTDSTGGYRIDGLSPGSATMRFSAVGYTSETVIRSFENAGEFRVDYALRAGEGSSLSLTALTSDQPRYSAYAPVSIRVEAQNIGAQATAGTVGVTILDPQGKVLESLLATWVDANGVVQRRFDFPVGATAVTVPWNTKSYAPGVYVVIAKIYQGSEDSPSGGLVEIAEKQTSFAIDPTQAIASVTLTPLPGFTNLGAAEQIGFKLDIVNRSNIPVTSELSYQLLAPSAAVIHGATATIQLEAEEGSKSMLLDGFPYVFAASGLYQSTVAWVNGAVAADYEGKVISVAPGTRIDPSQNIVPDIVTPDGDKRIRIDIRLQGVEQK